MIPIFFFISLVTYICYIGFKCSNGLIELKTLNYNSKKYFDYIKKNAKKLFITPELLFILFLIIAANANEKITGISMIIIYMFLSLYLILTKKKKLTIGKTIIPIVICIVILYLLLFCFIAYDYYITHSSFLIYDYRFIYYFLVILMGYFVYYIILISNIIVNLIKKLLERIKRNDKHKKKKK